MFEKVKRLIVSVDELWLKGKNRNFYFKALRTHIKEVVNAYHKETWEYIEEHERVILASEECFQDDLIVALKLIPGINSITFCHMTDFDLESCADGIVEALKAKKNLPKTFKVITKRANKTFPQTSMQISEELGGLILERIPELKVDVHHPELVVDIKVLNRGIFYSISKEKGFMGLPWNTSGHLLSLISGGFDSPVASFQMLRRGCRISYVFFYAYPFVGVDVKKKIMKMVAALAKYQPFSRLHVISFGHIQEAISNVCHEEYRTLLFRKVMMDVAGKLAEEIHAEALLTGDSLGQVSSQTLANLKIIDEYTPMSILRPLVGHTKMEIIGQSQIAGTHDISIIPHDDACSMFAPKRPIINPNPEYFKKVVGDLNLEELIVTAVKERETLTFDLKGELKNA